jgi:hypothetical protein
MLAFMFGLRFDESRSMLIAFQLSSRTKRLCSKYNIETHEISREAVRRWRSTGK